MKDSIVRINEASRLIMQKSKEERLPSDNTILRKNFESFPYVISLFNSNEYGQIMNNTIISSLEFRIYEQGATIFKYKEPYTTMIIIIEGSIVVYKPPIEHKNDDISSNNDKIKKSYIKETNRAIDRILNQGEAYGAKELKILRKHPCDVEAKSQCIIGILTLTDFSLIFEKTSFLEKMNINHFLLSISFFSNISHSMVENLQETMVKEVYNLGDHVIKQGDPVKKIYIVRKGLFQVSLKYTRKFFNEFDMNYFDNLVKEPQRFTSRRRFELQDSYKSLIEYKLINLGPGEIICDFEYKHKSENSYFTIQCTINNSELMSIDLNQFTMFLLPKNKIRFNKLVEEKLIYLRKRIKTIRINHQKFNIQKNKYIDAILSKIPNNNNEENSSKKCLLKSISHEKKSYKVIFAKKHPKKNYALLVKRMKLNSALSVEYSDRNDEIKDELMTNSTYITKKRIQSPICRKVNIKKAFFNHKPYQIHFDSPRTPHISHNILSSNFSNDTNRKREIKNNKKLLWFSYSKDSKELSMNKMDKSKTNLCNNVFKITKKVFLKNNSSTISANINSLIPCCNSKDSVGF